MKSSPKALSAVAMAIALIVAGNPVAAQFGAASGLKLDQAAIQRSYDIQAQVARIEQDKAGFISELLNRWDSVLDHNVYDVSSQLLPLMQQATPLKLYAASLVGDYQGMVQVLRGELSAVRVVNTLTTPQAPSAQGPITGQAPIGSTANSLVFTPIAPCRIVDTRGGGARTGLIGANAARTFDLTTGGFGKGQGGDLACPGLPAFNHASWSVNITATGYSNLGYLTVYPFGGAFPSTSLLNFAPSIYAIANNGPVRGCYGCTESINVFSGVSASHVIIDVYGYFERAAGFAETDKLVLAGTTATVASGAYIQVIGGSCPAGTLLIGGAQTNSSGTTSPILTSDHNFSGTTWYEFVKNNGTTSQTVTVYSTCLDLQTATP